MAGFKVEALDRNGKPVSSRVHINTKQLEPDVKKTLAKHIAECPKYHDESRPPSRFHQSSER
jgi:hypothetical protein